MQNTSQRIPSLDGLRAVSILLVLLSHFFLRAKSHSALGKAPLTLSANGSVGVSVFFVISGFLITLLLMKEEHRYGRIDLASFYVRRVFRILPASLGLKRHFEHERVTGAKLREILRRARFLKAKSRPVLPIAPPRHRVFLWSYSS